MNGTEDMVNVPRRWLAAYLDDDSTQVYVDGVPTSLWELLSSIASESPQDKQDLRLDSDRYQWLRNHAVRIQGSQIWYQGSALDIRVDVGRDHVAEQKNCVLELLRDNQNV